MPRRIAQTFDGRNPDALRRRLIDPRSLLRPRSITPDLLSPALFRASVEDQSPGFHEDRWKQDYENGQTFSVARADHNHELTYLRVGSDRTRGGTDADYVDPVSNVVGSLAEPGDKASRRIVSWDYDEDQPLPSVPAQVWARYSTDSGSTWTAWEMVGAVPPRVDSLVYDADSRYVFDGSTVLDQYRIVLPGYGRDGVLSVVRTNEDGKVDAGFLDGVLPSAIPVPVAEGGTGATTASGARSNLGLGTMAVQNANAVAVTGGSIVGITDLAVADGGTGASTAAGARTNLDVDQAGTAATLDAAHVAAADPHTQYQKESERESAGGYAGLDGSSKVIKDPANASTTAGADKIPKASGAGKIDSDYVATLVGDSGAGGTKGLAPAPAAGDAAAAKFLKADGTWSATPGGAPSGSAGGDLTGTYPNPTLAAAGPGATGPIGSATVVPIVTIDAKGRVTALSSTTIAGVAPGGSAGGDLSGSYPNPTVAKVAGVTPGVGGLAILDDADAAAMRTTLGLGGAALLAVGTTAGTVAAGDDARMTDPRAVKATDIADTALAINTTTSETTLWSKSIASMAAGDRILVRLWCSILNNSGGARTFIVRVKLGATTLHETLAVSVAASATRRAAWIELDLAAFAATNVQRLGGSIFIGAATAPTTGTGSGGTPTPWAILGTSAEDTTSAKTLSVTVQPSFSDANLEWKLEFGHAYPVKS